MLLGVSIMLRSPDAVEVQGSRFTLLLLTKRDPLLLELRQDGQQEMSHSI